MMVALKVEPTMRVLAAKPLVAKTEIQFPGPRMPLLIDVSDFQFPMTHSDVMDFCQREAFEMARKFLVKPSVPVPVLITKTY